MVEVVLVVHLVLWIVLWARAARMLRCEGGIIRPGWRRNVTVDRIDTSSHASSRELYVGVDWSERLAELLRVERSVSLVIRLSPILVMTGRGAVSRMVVAW